ncbi:hypothetical protein [Nonomuraea cavernae]|uniref:Uncharacterized protein n=1 Tax=Nonomuraea cavernae TaxID=2045107 RepID=A0A917Z0S8_9ACTN|nr:hypothetical protein [Nonomuraea cavernae]MCA2187648.1 hypothetical protein [Nonomuraea cavernae]GGO70924.1 hypothetical protein GCM10012289_35480 [Nonomuraea cavernae]
MGGEQRKFELSGPQIGGSALAAVTAAAAASYLGVAGTVIGAAVVSIASTVASAVYTHYLKRTGDKVKQHTVIARLTHADREEPLRENEGEGALAMAAHATVRDDDPDQPESTLVMAPVEAPRAKLPWIRVAVAATLVFAVSMGGILLYQGIAGTTVHEQLRGPVSDKGPAKAPVEEERRSREPSPAVTTPSGDPAPTAPVPTVTVTATPTPSATPPPTPTPTDTGPAEPVDPTSAPPEPTERPDVGEEAPASPAEGDEPAPGAPE